MSMRGERGLTLVELLTVVAIASILAMVAVPSFTRLIASQNLKQGATKLQLALMVARSEGLKRNANVKLVPITAGQWDQGWNVQDAGGVTIATYPAVSGLTITGPASVIYQSSGRTSAVASSSFQVSSPKVTDVRCVTISVTGVPSVSTSAC